MMTASLFTAALLAASPPALATEPVSKTVSVHRYALLVGSNDGGTDRVLLRYAETDARAVSAVLSQLGGVEPANRRLLLDPTRSELLRAFDDLRQRLAKAPGSRTEVVFYYSGHSDETGLLLGGEHFGYKDLRATISGLPAQVRIGILDSCASGAMVRGKGGVRRAPFLVDASTDVKGYAYLTSSSADEAAQEADRIQGSFFTHSLVTGLRGAADVSRDGKVTFNEAYQYAFHATLAGTERTSYGPQHPGYDIQMAGSGDLVLTDLRATSAGLALGASGAGDTTIRDAEGRLVVELAKTSGQPVDLGLAPGTYKVVVRQDTRFAEKLVTLEEGDRALLADTDFRWNRGEVAVARGDVGSAKPESGFRMTLFPGVGIPRDDDVLDHVVLNWAIGRSAELQGYAASLGGYYVEGDAKGAMTSIGGNVVGGELDGAQLAVGFNSAGELDGFQWAQGGINMAGPVQGTQLALINKAQDVQGAQLGVINVGGKVEGLQLGLINVAEESKAPIGLLSFVKKGRHAPAIYASTEDAMNLSLKLGGTVVYNVIAFGGDTGEDFYWHYGMGAKVPAGERLFFDFDIGVARYRPIYGYGYGYDSGFYPRTRITMGFRILKHLNPFLGVSYDFRLDPEPPGNYESAESLFGDLDGGFGMPAAFAGLEF